MPNEKEVEGVGENGVGVKKYKLAVTHCHEDVEYSIRNIVKNILITMCMV